MAMERPRPQRGLSESGSRRGDQPDRAMHTADRSNRANCSPMWPSTSAFVPTDPVKYAAITITRIVGLDTIDIFKIG
jgi:hypothetical protein